MSEEKDDEPQVRLDQLALGGVPDVSNIRPKKLSTELILDDDENPAGWDIDDPEPKEEAVENKGSKEMSRGRHVAKQLKGMKEKLASNIKRIATMKSLEDRGDYNPHFDGDEDVEEGNARKRGYSLEEELERQKMRRRIGIGAIALFCFVLIISLSVGLSGGGDEEEEEENEVAVVLKDGESVLEIDGETTFGDEIGDLFVAQTISDSDRIFSFITCNNSPVQCLGVTFLEQAPIFIGDCFEACESRETVFLDPFGETLLQLTATEVSDDGILVSSLVFEIAGEEVVMSLGLNEDLDEANVFRSEFDVANGERFELRGIFGNVLNGVVQSLGFVIAEI